MRGARASRQRPVFTRSQLAALVLGLIVLAACTALRVTDPYPLRMARELAFDEFQRFAPRAYSPAPVRVVDIDEATLAEIGQWPWPRSDLARLVQRLDQLGATAVAFDMVFPEPDRLSPARLARQDDLRAALGADLADALAPRLPDNDRLFADAIRTMPVVLGFGVVPGASNRRPQAKAGLAFTGADPRPVLPAFAAAAVNLPGLEDAAQGVGALTLSPLDTQGVVRRIPLLWSDGKSVYPSLSVELLRVSLGERSIAVHSRQEPPHAATALGIGPYEVPTTAAGELRLRFSRDVSARYVSAARLFSGQKDQDLEPLIKGHLVLVGTSAVGLLDARATPLAETVPGVSIHAQVLEQILTSDYLQRPDWAEPFECAWVVALGLIVTVSTVMFPPLAAFIYGGSVAIVTSLGAWAAFRGGGLLLDPLYPSATGLVLYFALVSFRYFVSDRERRFVRQAFARYVAPSYLSQIERNPGLLRLGGEEREVTILFLDIRNFTGLSERLSPREVVDLLNVLFGRVSDDILAEGGTIDKYIGDSIMAFWNAPVPAADHVARACRAALRIRRTIRELNDADAFGLRRRGDPLPDVSVGIGINTGTALVGNMGSEARFNYSAVGDAVNVASRVEGQAKAIAFDIVVAEPVAIAAPAFAFLEAGSLTLRGKAGREKLYILLGDETLAQGAEFAEILQAHEDLLVATRSYASDWGDRLYACFAAVSGGQPMLRGFYGALSERLADFRATTADGEPSPSRALPAPLGQSRG